MSSILSTDSMRIGNVNLSGMGGEREGPRATWI